jgi:hypothetical protein
VLELMGVDQLLVVQGSAAQGSGSEAAQAGLGTGEA